MITVKKIPPTTAILLCINSIIGAGLFINPQPLTALAGAYGFLGYVISTLILLPLVISIAELAALHPVAGGLYVYSKTYLGPWAGFISGWAYFVGKTTSLALLMHKFVIFFQARISALHAIPTIAIDFFMLGLLVFLNSAGLSVGGRVQYLFTALKATPIFFTFCIGFFLFDPTNMIDFMDFTGILYTIPLAIFPLLGFEIICSIGNQIEDAQKNIKRVILTAISIVAGINILYQLTTFGILGKALANISEPTLVIVLRALAGHPAIASTINGLVFASIIGACFSILSSNCWNLHTIAKHGHLPGSTLLTRVNRFNVPWVSLIIEAGIGCLILSITSTQVPLQNVSVLAQIIAYGTTAVAAWYATRIGALKKLHSVIPLLALASSAFIFSICLSRLISFGVSLPFVFILGGGIVLAALTKKNLSKN